MAETTTQAHDVRQLLLGGKGDAAQYMLLRPAQARSAEARRQLERLVIELKENPSVEGRALSREEAALVLGVGLWALGRLEEAIAHLAGGHSAEAEFFLGQCYLEGGHYAKAADAFGRAQRGKAATKRLAALAEAEAMAKGGKIDAALSAARGLARTYADEPAAHYLLGLCLDLSGRYEEAAAEYEKALRLRPGHPGACFRLGALESLRGNEVRGIEHYAVLASSPAVYTNALINLGVAYEDQGDFDRAVECYRRVLRVEPNHPRARMFLKDAHAALDMACDDDEQRELERREKLMTMPISDFEFSVRARNCLQRVGVQTLGDLCRMTEDELLSSPNFGEGSLQEIKEILQARGLRIGEAREEVPVPAGVPSPAGAAGPADQTILTTPIAELNLSMRSRKCMERLGITTIGQLVERSEEELLASRNFGRTSLTEIREKLARYGLDLAAAPAEPGEEEDEDEELVPEGEVVPHVEEPEDADDDE